MTPEVSNSGNEDSLDGIGHTDPTVTADPVPARILGETQLISLLGTGGMGEVWLGLDQKLERRVAVKMMRAELASDEAAVSRFYREARAVARLNHPNIVQIFHIGEEDNTLYFTMEYVEGETLGQRIKRDGPVLVRDAINIMRQVVEGLAYACESGVIHRDIKPGNIMLDKSGRVRIADFGLAKLTTGDSQMTTTGIPMGSPNYMSPEQAKGDPVDHRSDIYSLGITFYQMLTADVPFHAATPMSVLLKHLQEPLPEPEFLRGMKEGRLLEVIKKMTAKTPDQRYSDYKELRIALDRIDGPGFGAVTETIPGEGFPLRALNPPAPGKSQRKVWFISLGIAVLLGLLAAQIQVMRDRGQQAEHAPQESDTADVPHMSSGPLPTPSATAPSPITQTEAAVTATPTLTSPDNVRGELPAPRDLRRRNRPVANMIIDRNIEQAVLENYRFADAVNKIEELLADPRVAPARRAALASRIESMKHLRDFKAAVIRAAKTPNHTAVFNHRTHGLLKITDAEETTLVFNDRKGQRVVLPWADLEPQEVMVIARQLLPKGGQMKGVQEFRKVYELNGPEAQ